MPLKVRKVPKGHLTRNNSMAVPFCSFGSKPLGFAQGFGTVSPKPFFFKIFPRFAGDVFKGVGPHYTLLDYIVRTDTIEKMLFFRGVL